MNINLTLIGQSIAFAIFVWFSLKFIWPFLIKALEERKARIADGLAAAEEGRKAKEKAETEIEQVRQEARAQAKEIVANANRRADQMVEEARSNARVEGDKLVELAKGEIEQQANQARESLRKDVVRLAIAGAEQVLMREVDERAHAQALEKLAAEL